ncbi:MAG: GtrA family protein [Clostridium sp.]|jgi:putative flippase GtrA|nr:GtrA family protein [Clostridium sp.]
MIEKCRKVYQAHEEIVNYLVVGVLTTVVSLGAKFLCAATILDAEVPWQNMALSLVNWTTGVAFAYFTNRKFVFKSKEQDRLKEAAKFVVSRISTLLLDAVINLVMVNLMGLGTFFATLFSAVAVTVANYIFSKLFVFRK